MAPDKPISLINHRQWINYFRNVDFKTPDYKKKFVAIAHTMEQWKLLNIEHRNNKIQYIKIMVSCALHNALVAMHCACEIFVHSLGWNQ